jgi:hypothetical protein
MIADYNRLAKALKFNRLRWRRVAVRDPLEIILLSRKRGRSIRKTVIGEDIRFSHPFDRQAEPEPRFGRLGQLKKWQFLSPNRLVASEPTPFKIMRILNQEGGWKISFQLRGSTTPQRGLAA